MKGRVDGDDLSRGIMLFFILGWWWKYNVSLFVFFCGLGVDGMDGMDGVINFGFRVG